VNAPKAITIVRLNALLEYSYESGIIPTPLFTLNKNSVKYNGKGMVVKIKIFTGI